MGRSVISALFGVIFLIGLMHSAGQVTGGPRNDDADNCLRAPYEDVSTPAQIKLQEIAMGIKPALLTFPSLLAVFEDGGTSLCLSDELISEKAYFDVEADRIVLSTSMPRDLSRIVLVHELRHADQIARGVCPSQSLEMKEFARGAMALEADANVVAALVAWKQKAEGKPELWLAFESWPMTMDIAARFAEVMNARGDVAEAASAAFGQWYASKERTELYYIASCSGYLDRQDQSHALPQYLRLADNYFSQLCVLPDGGGYDCADIVR